MVLIEWKVKKENDIKIGPLMACPHLYRDPRYYHLKALFGDDLERMTPTDPFFRAEFIRILFSIIQTDVDHAYREAASSLVRKIVELLREQKYEMLALVYEHIRTIKAYPRRKTTITEKMAMSIENAICDLYLRRFTGAEWEKLRQIKGEINELLARRYQIEIESDQNSDIVKTKLQTIDFTIQGLFRKLNKLGKHYTTISTNFLSIYGMEKKGSLMESLIALHISANNCMSVYIREIYAEVISVEPSVVQSGTFNSPLEAYYITSVVDILAMDMLKAARKQSGAQNMAEPVASGPSPTVSRISSPTPSHSPPSSLTSSSDSSPGSSPLSASSPSSSPSSSPPSSSPPLPPTVTAAVSSLAAPTPQKPTAALSAKAAPFVSYNERKMPYRHRYENGQMDPRYKPAMHRSPNPHRPIPLFVPTKNEQYVQ